MRDTVSDFAADKYVVVPSMLGEPQLSSLYKYARKRMAMNPTEVEKMNIDPSAEPTPAAYGDMMIDMLLANLTPKVEQTTGLKLFPTFSYSRVYRPCGMRDRGYALSGLYRRVTLAALARVAPWRRECDARTRRRHHLPRHRLRPLARRP